jgi:starch phosphorylase
MLREYVQDYYLPLAEAFRRRDADSVRDIRAWLQLLEQHWQHIRFGDVTCERQDDTLAFDVQVYLDALPPDTIDVQLYAEATADEAAVYQSLRRGKRLAGTENSYVFRGAVAANRPAADYTPRIVPAHELATIPLESPCILWYR